MNRTDLPVVVGVLMARVDRGELDLPAALERAYLLGSGFEEPEPPTVRYPATSFAKPIR